MSVFLADLQFLSIPTCLSDRAIVLQNKFMVATYKNVTQQKTIIKKLLNCPTKSQVLKTTPGVLSNNYVNREIISRCCSAQIAI